MSIAWRTASTNLLPHDDGPLGLELLLFAVFFSSFFYQQKNDGEGHKSTYRTHYSQVILLTGESDQHESVVLDKSLSGVISRRPPMSSMSS